MNLISMAYGTSAKRNADHHGLRRWPRRLLILVQYQFKYNPMALILATARTDYMDVFVSIESIS